MLIRYRTSYIDLYYKKLINNNIYIIKEDKIMGLF